MEKPSIAGGKPIRDAYLVFGRPDVGTEEINSVIEVLKSGWLSTGPKTKLFKEKFKEYVGCKHAIALNSCTSGLHLALLCSDIQQGDEVIVTPMTFAATVNVIEHVGATPIFVDIEEDSYNIDANKISEAITPKTKAIIPVHFGGLPCDMEMINKIANEHNLIVIEDAAHAIGAEYRSQKIGSGENQTCFSFYATKNLTAGEGGMITLSDDELADKIRLYSLHGLSKHAWQRFGKGKKKTYEVIFPGYKYNMQDLNAAIALCQLKKIDKLIDIRREYARLYFEEFENFKLLELPPDDNNRKNVWHLFPILLRLENLTITREQFIEALHKENIGSGIHYVAVHLQPYYQKYSVNQKLQLKRAEYVSERTVSIPLQTSMTREDLLDVVSGVKKILNYYRR
jgi:dTDP-4-amino-4,6-dideoxygalactose transaminase